MHLVAGAGVGAGHREQCDLLALEDIVGGLDLEAFPRHHAKLGLGQLVANFDRHRQSSLIVRMFLRAFFGGKETTSPSFDGDDGGNIFPSLRAKRSNPKAAKPDWIASSLSLLAMTAVGCSFRPPPSFRRAIRGAGFFRHSSSAGRS